MARSKRLRECEITSLRQDPRSNSTESEFDTESDSEPSSEPDSQSQSQIQEQANVGYDEIVEIVDEQGNVRTKRGVTRAKDVWSLPGGEKIVVSCNKFGQPVKKSGGILGGWLGTVARKANLCPIHYPTWKKMPNSFKINIINLTRSKFSIPSKECVNAWILKSVSRKWKGYKYELKAKYKVNDQTEQQIASTVPNEIMPQQWIDLVRIWFSEKSELYSRIGKMARANVKTPHTTGSMSFARKRQEFEDENHREPSRIQFFASTHKQKDGNYINDTSKRLVEKCMTEVAKRSVSSESPDAIFQLENEVFGKLIGKEQYGRVRGYGLGPSPTQVFGPQAQFRFMDNAEQNSVELQSQMKTMQNNYESKLAEMQQNYDTKLAEMQQDFQSQLNQVASMLQIFARSSNNLGGVASQFPDFARSSDSGNAGENPAPDIWFT
ncbi:uncharacterized protein LOC109708647 isoform X2 [Ananas comosus]|nr:uncharacterized protein LOC109708647 isoform X2 [Ananas comosus]